MSKLQTLREQRLAVANEVKTLLDSTEGKDWQASHQEKYDDGMQKIDAIDAEMKRHEDYINLAVDNAVNGDPSGLLLNRAIKEPARQNSESIAFKNYLVGGLSALNHEDIERLRARQTPDIRNAMSTTTNSEGGFTVAPEFYTRLTEALKEWGGIRTVATIMQTGTGADMNFPATDATAEVGEIVGQNAAVTLGETTFSNLTMSVYKYSSKKIALPFELLQDSMFDLESYIRDLLTIRIGRITSQHFTTGTGTGQPRGVVTAASSGKVGSTGQTLTVTYDDLVDLEHSIDPAYRSSAKYLMNDASVKVLRKLKDTQNRPIFVPGYEVNVPGGAPDTLLGRQIVISQEMPVMAANAKSILFGDFSKYIIREVMDLTMFRMADSGFILNGQIGFVAFNRQGGNLIDVGGAVKFYQNSAT